MPGDDVERRVVEGRPSRSAEDLETTWVAFAIVEGRDWVRKSRGLARPLAPMGPRIRAGERVTAVVFADVALGLCLPVGSSAELDASPGMTTNSPGVASMTPHSVAKRSAPC